MDNMYLSAFPDGLAPQILTSILRDCGILHKASVSSIEVVPLKLDQGIMSEYVSIHLSYDFSEPGAPESLFCKFTHSYWAAKGAVSLYPFGEREVIFYKDFALNSDVPTPKCYFAAADPKTERYALLLEDLSPYSCGRWIDGCNLQEARLALLEISKLHSQWWGRTADLQSRFPLLPFQEIKGALARYHQCLPRFLSEKPTGISDTVAKTAERISDNFGVLMQELYTETVTLVHDDYQLDNIFFGSGVGTRHKSNTSADIAIIDWQYSKIGKAALDVSRFVSSNLVDNVSSEDRQQLLRQYHESLMEQGVRNYDWSQFTRDYRLSLVRLLFHMVFWIGLNVVRNETERHKYHDVIFPRYCREIEEVHLLELA